MIVLGIDPGIGTTGTAAVQEAKGQLSLISSLGITTPAHLSSSQRLLTLFQSMVALIKKVKPDVAALETLFFNTNVTTAFSVGQARGVVMLSLAQANIPVVEYNPMQVKVALTGYGAAKKMQLNRMVAQILHLSKPLAPDDVADAAAIALTHCFSYKLKRLENISR